VNSSRPERGAGCGSSPTEDESPCGRPRRHRLRGRGAACLLAYAASACALALFLRLRYPGVPDPDSFYHFGHAALYSEKGLGTKAFPWIFYSVINRFSGDTSYGFHVLLIPFTFTRDPVLGIKLAAVLETAAVLVIASFVMRRHRVTYDFAWPYLLVFAAPPMVYTVLMTRPQTLTMAFFALLLSFLVAGGAWGVFLSSFAIGFVHLSIFPIVALVVLVVAVTKGVVERSYEWHKWVAAVAGVAAGWLMRPNPLGVARIEYSQIVVHEVVRRARVPLSFGREWDPVTGAALATFLYFLVLWASVSMVFAVAALRRRAAARPNDRTLMWSSLVLSIIFFTVTVLATKRATPLWVTCVVVFSGKVFTCILDPREKRPGQLLSQETRLVAAFALAGLFALMVWDGLSAPLARGTTASQDPHRMKATAEWLRRHSRPGELVYNVNWDMFPELFFWNPRDYYVSGLDPIFLYAYDQELYWRAHHIDSDDTAARTCATRDCGKGSQEDTYIFVRRDLAASYVVMDSRRNPALEAYLGQDPRFVLAFRDGPYAVYEVR
jgi:hypothetical protein